MYVPGILYHQGTRVAVSTIFLVTSRGDLLKRPTSVTLVGSAERWRPQERAPRRGRHCVSLPQAPIDTAVSGHDP